MQKILIIEDDTTINGLLHNILKRNGYSVDSTYQGDTGLDKALHEEYSLIIMDLMLPQKSGEEIIARLRKAKDTPIIILSAKCEIQDKIELLRLGADDYITKPFDIDEVLLRIEAIIRRTTKPKTKKVSYKEIVIDTDAKRVYINESEIICTAMEYAILELLVTNSSKIFSKRNLFESVTGADYLSDDNTINVHISNLRKKIAEHTDEKYIETVYGMGYRLSS